MATINVFKTIDLCIKDKVANLKSFTAFDITLYAQKLLKEKFLHEEVKAYIHDEMEKVIQTGFYKKEQDTTYPAWKYVYDKPQFIPVATPKVPPASLSFKAGLNKFKKALTKLSKGTMQVQGALIQPAPKVLKRDNRSRVCIPKVYLDKIGAKPGDRISVYAGNSTKGYNARLIKDNHGYGFIVDKSTNVRLSNSTLGLRGFKTTDNIGIEGTNNEIYLKKV